MSAVISLSPVVCGLGSPRRDAVPKGSARAHELCISLPSPGSRERCEAEEFVMAGFAATHAAQVRSFMPELLVFRGAMGPIRGVLGLRSAYSGNLFLEQYLDLPVERAIAERASGEVARAEIVEVGNLASASGREAMRLVALLPSYLLARGFRWIVFTGTAPVRGWRRGFEAPLLELAHAERARVSQGVDDWGRYYESDPRVFAGYLPDSLRLPGFKREELRD